MDLGLRAQSTGGVVALVGFEDYYIWHKGIAASAGYKGRNDLTLAGT
ncbi:MAG: hypothetical protein FWE28_07655 [Oscillospiraceae bacterium]|nr:hypothetical protein [Oscillospiraceae bacterium]